MSKIEDIDGDELRNYLSDADDPKAVKRLMIALAYYDGVSVSTLSNRYGVPRSTIYHWLNLFEEQSIEEAISDDEQPGRPRKLSDEQVKSLRSALHKQPDELGFDTSEWTPRLIRQFVRDEFDINYSLTHCHRLLNRYSNQD